MAWNGIIRRLFFSLESIELNCFIELSIICSLAEYRPSQNGDLRSGQGTTLALGLPQIQDSLIKGGAVKLIDETEKSSWRADLDITSVVMAIFIQKQM